MASKPLLPTSSSTPGPSQPSAPTKERGAIRRTTKAAHKLKVLPEQPDPPTQSKIINEEDEDGDGDDEDEDATASTSEPEDDDDDEVEVSLIVA